jgi:hypothetical protein
MPVPTDSGACVFDKQVVGKGGGGGEARRRYVAGALRSTEAARLSSGSGSTGQSLSRRSEFCLANVVGRGKLGMTGLGGRVGVVL